MDYEVYYNELLGELKRATIVLTEYDDLEDHFINSAKNKITYESYVLSSMPIGIADIVYILTSGKMSIKYDIELRNTLKNNTRLLFTKGLYDLFKTEKTEVIKIFKSLSEISSDKVLIDLLNDISADLNKNEERLVKLKEFIRTSSRTF